VPHKAARGTPVRCHTGGSMTRCPQSRSFGLGHRQRHGGKSRRRSGKAAAGRNPRVPVAPQVVLDHRASSMGAHLEDASPPATPTPIRPDRISPARTRRAQNMRCGRPHVSSRNRGHADKLLERSPLMKRVASRPFARARMPLPATSTATRIVERPAFQSPKGR